jgi:hypothetical protein
MGRSVIDLPPKVIHECVSVTENASHWDKYAVVSPRRMVSMHTCVPKVWNPSIDNACTCWYFNTELGQFNTNSLLLLDKGHWQFRGILKPNSLSLVCSLLWWVLATNNWPSLVCSPGPSRKMEGRSRYSIWYSSISAQILALQSGHFVVCWACARSDIQLHALIIEHCMCNIQNPFFMMSSHSIDESILWRSSVFLEGAVRVRL